ncbi:unnamed protein product [Prunus brigantina]
MVDSATSRVTELSLDQAGYSGSLSSISWNLPYLHTLNLPSASASTLFGAPSSTSSSLFGAIVSAASSPLIGSTSASASSLFSSSSFTHSAPSSLFGSSSTVSSTPSFSSASSSSASTTPSFPSFSSSSSGFSFPSVFPCFFYLLSGTYHFHCTTWPKPSLFMFLFSPLDALTHVLFFSLHVSHVLSFSLIFISFSLCPMALKCLSLFHITGLPSSVPKPHDFPFQARASITSSHHSAAPAASLFSLKKKHHQQHLLHQQHHQSVAPATSLFSCPSSIIQLPPQHL